MYFFIKDETNFDKYNEIWEKTQQYYLKKFTNKLIYIIKKI